MNQCTHEERAKYWKGIIKACGLAQHKFLSIRRM